jgi:7-dehydrocholesterol reductase
LTLNWQADRQRHRVRASDGAAAVWGRPPVLIQAPYTTGDGVERKNLLLASGWWGVARHFSYSAELAVAVLWTVPAGFNHVMPWLYPIFLTILLVHRTKRDDARCREKYGGAWREYCRLVPWRILPGIY